MTASALDITHLRSAYEQVRDELLAERTPAGHWVGELSSSALSTATAVSALAIVRGAGLWPALEIDDLICRGVAYLVRQQNPDGGFGDTDLSHSNIATTYLVVAAMHLADGAVGNALRGVPGPGMDADSAGPGMPQRAFPTEIAALLTRANAYIDSKNGLAGLRERYGIDKTFVVPIMTNLALAGLLDWRQIDALPFELACVPQSFYRFVGMPVVSYAIPALVAIGQARYFHAPPRNPISRLIRWLSISRSLNVLRQMQPDSGGYLEATPLTAFVVMSLASIDSSHHAPRDEPDIHASREGRITRSVMTTMDEVIHHGVKFLAAQVRPDGSWPIDTNLATWNTTLAINALAAAGEDVAELLGVAAGAVGNALRGVPGATVDADVAGRGSPQRAIPTGNVLDWLLSCQHTKRHPFTGADPGGFGWSDLSGAVPDADDTPGALLAISAVRLRTDDDDNDTSFAVHYAASWLLHLQNRDKGWPTFCRGWGKLPFDRSGIDLTAHVIRSLTSSRAAILLYEDLTDRSLINYADGFEPRACPISRVDKAIRTGLEFLRRRQNPDGSWSPLWFGNQDHPQEDNPVYGTAKVLMAYRDLGLMDSPEARRGVAWLVANQNADGGWGSGVWRAAELKNEKWKLQSANCGEQNQTGDQASLCNLQLPITNLQSSVEETALAVEALLAACPSPQPPVPSPEVAAAQKGLNWLLDRVEAGQHRQPAPIGFYFAKLWYYERLYPLTFTVAALGRACRQFARPEQLEQPSATRAT